MAFNPEPLVPSPTTPKEKGDHGEKMVSTLISKLPAAANGTIVLINDIRLPYPDGKGKKIQIDHILVCPSVVLVIETKNWAGHIHGTADANVWTQILPGGRKQAFGNPVTQCKAQGNIVERHLGAADIIVPVVVMVGDGELKTDAGQNVTTLQPLLEYIVRCSEQPKLLDVKEVAARLLRAATEPDTAPKKKPVKAAKATASKPKPKPATKPASSNVGGSDLFEQLRAWRKRTATEENLSPGYVLSDKTLQEIVDRQPATRGDLLGITGIGPAKADKYGPDILAILEAEQAATGQTAAPLPPSSSPRHVPTGPAPAGKPDVLGEAFKLAKDMFRNRNK